MLCARNLLFGLLVLLLPTAAWCGDCRSSLSFADALTAEGDHYRAITEYKRFLHLCPEAEAGPRAALAIAENYLAGTRWEQAEGALDRVLRDFSDTAEADKAALLRCSVPAKRGDFALARERYRSLLAETSDSARRDAIRYRIAWTLIEEGAFDAAGQELRRIDSGRAGDLTAELGRLERMPRKSPRLAGGLSALLPGAGQLYAGRPRDAGLAFLLNAAFILGALESFDQGNEVVGGILVFFELGWYSGNIFNAANSAHKFNRDRLEEGKKPLRERFGLTLSGDDHGALLGMRLDF